MPILADNNKEKIMDSKQVLMDLEGVGKDVLKLAGQEIADKVLGEALDLAAAAIPGQIDDMIIAALKPILVQKVKDLMAAV